MYTNFYFKKYGGGERETQTRSYTSGQEMDDDKNQLLREPIYNRNPMKNEARRSTAWGNWRQTTENEILDERATGWARWETRSRNERRRIVKERSKCGATEWGLRYRTLHFILKTGIWHLLKENRQHVSLPHARACLTTSEGANRTRDTTVTRKRHEEFEERRHAINNSPEKFVIFCTKSSINRIMK